MKPGNIACMVVMAMAFIANPVNTTAKEATDLASTTISDLTSDGIAAASTAMFTTPATLNVASATALVTPTTVFVDSPTASIDPVNNNGPLSVHQRIATSVIKFLKKYFDLMEEREDLEEEQEDLEDETKVVEEKGKVVEEYLKAIEEYRKAVEEQRKAVEQKSKAIAKKSKALDRRVTKLFAPLFNRLPKAASTTTEFLTPDTNDMGSTTTDASTTPPADNSHTPSDDQTIPPTDDQDPKEKEPAVKGWCSPRVRALQQYHSIAPVTVMALAVFSWTMQDAKLSSVKTKRALCFFAWLGFTFALVMTIGDGFCIAPAPEGPAGFHSKIVGTAVVTLPGACVATWEYWKQIEKERPGFIDKWFGWLVTFYQSHCQWISYYGDKYLGRPLRFVSPFFERVFAITKYWLNFTADIIELAIKTIITLLQHSAIKIFHLVGYITAVVRGLMPVRAAMAPQPNNPNNAATNLDRADQDS